MIVQMLALSNDDAIRGLILQEYARRKHMTMAPEGVLWILLQKICRLHDAYIVIDGLDECVDPRIMLDNLIGLSAHARVILFSRTLPLAEPQSITSHVINMQTDKVAGDITKWCSDRFDTVSFALSLNDEAKSQLLSRVLQKSDGMFLWAHLAMEQMDESTTPREVLERSEALPVRISAIYEAALRKFAKAGAKKHARMMNILTWTLSVNRPLSLEEMSEAIIMTATTEKILPDDRVFSIAYLVESCRPLIEVNPVTSTIGPCHASLREYVISLTPEAAIDLGFQFIGGEGGMLAHVGRLCLQYLRLDNIFKDSDSSDFELITGKKFPLFQYCVANWLDHTLALPADSTSRDHVLSYLRSSQSQAWLRSFLRFQRAKFGNYSYGAVLAALEKRLSNWVLTATPDQNDKQDLAFLKDGVFRPMLEGEMQTLQSHPGVDDATKLDAQFALYLHYAWSGNLCEAQTMMEQLLSRIGIGAQSDFEKMSPRELELLFHFSEIQGMTGNSKTSAQIGTKVHEARKYFFGPESFETAESAMGLAGTLDDLGDLKASEQMHRESLKILVNTRGETSLDTLREYNNFGNCLRLSHRPVEAEHYLDKALHGRLAILGPDSPSTLRTLDCLGVVYLELGRKELACNTHRQAFDGMRRAAGDHNLFTWRAAANLAAAEASLDHMEVARALSVRALIQTEKILGSAARETLLVAQLVARLHRGYQDNVSGSVLLAAIHHGLSSLGESSGLIQEMIEDQKAIPNALRKTRLLSATIRPFHQIVGPEMERRRVATSLFRLYTVMVRMVYEWVMGLILPLTAIPSQDIHRSR